MDLHSLARWTPLAGLLLLAAPASSQVVLVEQSGYLSAGAVSYCDQGEPGRDFAERTSQDLRDHQDLVTAQMASDCGASHGEARLDMTISGSTISGSMQVSSSLEQLLSAGARSNWLLRLRVTSPTAYVFVARGTTMSSGAEDVGLLVFSGPEPLQSAGAGLDDVEVRWEGVLAPGRTYDIGALASSHRSAGPSQEGATTRTASFELTFTEASVVTTPAEGFGRLKARYQLRE
jgi:hypothetical protein